MIKISPSFVSMVRSASVANDLWHCLQQSIQLEHSTIPPYLTALYSLKPGGNDEISRALKEIAIDEMLHMTIAANLLVAIGGKPRFTGDAFVPNYPSQLPMSIGDGLVVPLAPFSKDLLKSVFMEIEKPEEPLDIQVKLLGMAAPAAEPEFATIGEFYTAIRDKIVELGDGIFVGGTESQVTNLPWFSDEHLFPIVDVATAVRGIDIIVRQGEGTSEKPLTARGKPAHYYRFEALYEGKALIEDPNAEVGYSYGGAELPFDEDGVWPLPENPKLSNYAPGTPERAQVERFAERYSEMLTLLEKAYQGDPDLATGAIGQMYQMRALGTRLAEQGLGLVFEYRSNHTAGFKWRRTNAPVASSRTDDIWFVDENTGWAVNSNGQILKTTDGGASWREQLNSDAYMRCIAFANPSVGWAGTVSFEDRLFATRNGGDTWSKVTNLPELPAKICGITVLGERAVVGSGTNEPGDQAAVVMSRDGGASWTVRDMGNMATLLVDNHFVSPDRGWVVGGWSDKPEATREDVVPVVLYTEDGGETWRNLVDGIADTLRVGEWGWKIQFINDDIAVIALEAFDWAAILRSEDGGMTWTRLEVNDPQVNANIEGIGFINENTGWVGGWGDRGFQRGASSVTHDGGQTWDDSNEIGRFINRFRFIGSPLRVGYASGWTVYKYSRDPVPPPLTPNERRLLRENEPIDVTDGLDVPISIPIGTRRVRARVWDRFGTFVWSLLDDFGPAPGTMQLRWDFRIWNARLLPPGTYIIRVVADDVAESQLVRYRGPSNGGGGGGVEVNSYADVVALLDESVGGAGAAVGAHGAFWRIMSRDEFVAGRIFNVDLVTPGDGAGSGIIKALRGEAPFGSNLGVPGALYRSMPAGLAQIDEVKIAAIKVWIDNGAPE